MSVRERFCAVDDVCHTFAPLWQRYCLAHSSKRRHRPSTLALRAIMTMLILLHTLRYRHCKALYPEHVCRQRSAALPTLVSSTRYVALFPHILVPLLCYLHTWLSQWTGVSCIDPTKLAVCHHRRMRQQRVLRGCALKEHPHA